MKIKLDENIPFAMAELLRRAGHETATAADEKLSGVDDPVLLATATKERRLLMTFDADFADIRHYPLVTHAGIVVFRLVDQRWAALREPFQRLVASGVLERLYGGLAIVDETRVRIRFSGGEK